MEQPRFGGVALPPLSTPDGEGMSPESVADTMESTEFPTPNSHHASQADPDVQNVLEVLCQLGIPPHLQRHKLKHERQRDIGSNPVDNGVYCKNLLLKDKKGQAYLIVCGENDRVDLQVVKYHLSAQGNLHFASKESLWSLLRVKPGAVSPLALVHSPGGVRVLIDACMVRKIDQDVAQLYFHPLKEDLQVALTLSQLERFLNHCDITLESLPSLTSYSARRHYSNLTGGCRYKHTSDQEHKLKALKIGEVDEEVMEETGTPQQAAEQGEMMVQTETTFTQHFDLFQQLGIGVEAVPAKRNEGALNCTTLPCKSVYLKDKRENYFLFICHENQKVDFSSLKMQLKPKKKIVPLVREELWSLLHLHENQQHPFALGQLKQPQFLIALSDNLHCKGRVVLTFPHPADLSLRLQVTLKHLETFIKNTSHDFITLHMKGNIEELQAKSACSSSPKASELSKLPQPFNADSEDFPSPEGADERYGRLFQDQETVPGVLPAGQGGNLFYHLTAPLREWTLRFLRNLVRLLNQYLPNQILAVLRQSLFWNRMLTPGNNSTEEQTDHSEELANQTGCKEKHKMAKIAKLQQLIKESGTQVDLQTDVQPWAFSLKDDAEQCKTYLLEDGLSRHFIVLCTEDDDLSERNLRHLRTAFRSRGALHLVKDDGISHHLPWPEEPSVSWTQEDLNPVALMDLVSQTRGRIKVGMTGALYSFPDTMLRFDLPSLGVTLRLSYEDLETLMTQLDFRVVYLP